MMHRLEAIWCICFANMMLLHFVSQWCDVCHKMWRSHASLGEAVIIGRCPTSFAEGKHHSKNAPLSVDKSAFSCWLPLLGLNQRHHGLNTRASPCGKFALWVTAPHLQGKPANVAPSPHFVLWLLHADAVGTDPKGEKQKKKPPVWVVLFFWLPLLGLNQRHHD